MQTALLSVYRKDGIVEFARELREMGWDLLASGGTAKALADAGLPVHDVATIVGSEPILCHRVVSLSREIAAGLLAKDTPEDSAELERIGVSRIDLVCVDLYPLHKEIFREGATEESVTEMTDIGGPTLLREAAKGRRIVIAEPEYRYRVLSWLRDGRVNEREFVRELASRAEMVVARYCLASACYLSYGALNRLSIPPEN